jgi:hypothetical protein
VVPEGPVLERVPSMRMPQMSQKSSLAESCPLGHTAIVASWMRCR